MNKHGKGGRGRNGGRSEPWRNSLVFANFLLEKGSRKCYNERTIVNFIEKLRRALARGGGMGVGEIQARLLGKCEFGGRAKETEMSQKTDSLFS